MHARERRQLRLFVRRDTYGRYVSVPRLPAARPLQHRRPRAVRADPQEQLRRRVSVEFTVRISESTTARVHFVVHPPQGRRRSPTSTPPTSSGGSPRRPARGATTSPRAVIAEYGEERGARLARRYADSFPEAYKEDFTAAHRRASTSAGSRRSRATRASTSRSTSRSTPAAARPGSRSSGSARRCRCPRCCRCCPRWASRSSTSGPTSSRASTGRSFIYEFGLRYGQALPDRLARAVPGRAPRGLGRLQRDRRLQRAGARRRADLAAGDGAARLREVHAAGQHARSRRTTSRTRCAATSTSPGCWSQLFEARFDPGKNGLAADAEARTARVEEVEERIVPGARRRGQPRPRPDPALLPHPHQGDAAHQLLPDRRRRRRCSPYISFKLEPSAIPDLPEPRPQFEIFVYSPRVEGVHLRFGAVARGGLRWSDRRDDFRTEVLGLVKAQMVKNTVIVPVGAKGGFFCKQLPDPADRDAWLAEGVACYTTFISGLLDITDNLVDGETVPPRGVVRHDGDDSYLVVAADKGTATFSDIANGVAKDYGFWLGDAFASGGSVGYDHKAMGITARGAWVSVQRHFRERGIDCQTEDFTAVGIGDMSGDVFGNGMLCSEHTRLVAAFDHRDIFLDPDPDAATSYAERQRLFDLPRSCWQDYDTRLISEGGGVFPRSAEVDPARRRRSATALGLDDDVATMTPAELMKAILQAPVDLLWNGGIGTYVKARERDPRRRRRQGQRRDPRQRRATCGPSASARAATSASPSSAGSSTPRAAAGSTPTSSTTPPAWTPPTTRSTSRSCSTGWSPTATSPRSSATTLLAEMTDEVADLVLRDNYEQNLALANAAAQRAVAAARARGLDARLEQRRRARPRARGPAVDRARYAGGSSAARGSPRPSCRCCWPGPRSCWPTSCSPPTCPTTRTCDVDLHGVLPDADAASGFAGADRGAPAAPRDHRDPGRQRPGQRRRHDLLAAARGRDRRRRAAELTRANFVAREIFGSLPLRDELDVLRQRARRRRCRPGCGSRCAPWSSGPRAGWSTTGGRRSTARRRSTSSRDRVQAGDGRAARR